MHILRNRAKRRLRLSLYLALPSEEEEEVYYTRRGRAKLARTTPSRVNGLVMINQGRSGHRMILSYNLSPYLQGTPSTRTDDEKLARRALASLQHLSTLADWLDFRHVCPSRASFILKALSLSLLRYNVGTAPFARSTLFAS